MPVGGGAGGPAAGVVGDGDGEAEGGGDGGGSEGGDGGAGGDDGAVAEEEGVAGGGGEFFQVVRDEDGGEVGVGGGEGGEGGEEGFAGGEVETGSGFVEEEERGVGHEGAGDADALAFALGAGGDLAGGETGAAEEIEEVAGAGALGLADAVGEGPDGAGGAGEDDLFDGEPVEDFEGGVDDADPFAQVPETDLTEATAEDGDGTGAGVADGAGEGEEGALAGAVRAEEGPVLAAPDRPGDAIEDRGAVRDPDADVFDEEDRFVSVVHCWPFVRAVGSTPDAIGSFSPERYWRAIGGEVVLGTSSHMRANRMSL